MSSDEWTDGKEFVRYNFPQFYLLLASLMHIILWWCVYLYALLYTAVLPLLKIPVIHLAGYGEGFWTAPVADRAD